MLTISDFEACFPFYEKLLTYLGMKPVMRSETCFIALAGGPRRNHARDDSYRAEKFQQRRVGLHHVCLRARERGDVDKIYAFLKTIDAKIVHPPEDGPWAPGYYSVLFEDPDGIRLEVNHVPARVCWRDFETRLSALVKEFRSKEVDRALAERPDLLSVRDERGRNWLTSAAA